MQTTEIVLMTLPGISISRFQRRSGAIAEELRKITAASSSRIIGRIHGWLVQVRIFALSPPACVVKYSKMLA
ncbi:UNVERIFIED_CONTAM: hypothetical protein Sangu_1921000 [Sesamum angustifolium]|uniref:Uncharacterized protein n=1 Tax=Sesamum angustifolium TaxID=2727405 RepID=A0AAW2LW33_9LAMI